MNTYPIGTVSVFININEQQFGDLDENIINEISDTVFTYFLNELNENNITSLKCSHTWSRESIIETISFALISTAGYKFITDYDKIRNSLIKITENIKGLYLKIRHKKESKNLPEGVKETEIEILKKLPEDIKKYYEAGQKVMVIKEETIIVHKLAVMKSDIKTVLQIADIKDAAEIDGED